MRLYKYVPFDAGLKILEFSTVGFHDPGYFNDPFELSAFPAGDIWFDEFALIKSALTKSAGVLSPTRQPLNILMWESYGDGHSGMVVGIDCSSDLFTSEENNIVPVQLGSVVHVNTKP